MDPAQTPPTPSQNRFQNMINPRGFRNKAKWVKVVLFVLVLLIAVVASWYTTQNQLKLKFPSIGGNAPLESDDRPTREFYNQIKTENYDSLKEKAPNLVTQPNIVDEEIRQGVQRALENAQPTNHTLFVDSDPSIELNLAIIQGDIVTWTNNTGTTVVIDGGDWKSYIPLTRGTSFSQRFDFIGSYEYIISGIEGKKGLIQVVGAQ